MKDLENKKSDYEIYLIDNKHMQKDLEWSSLLIQVANTMAEKQFKEAQ